MADGLILEFDGLDAATYARVNEALGIDMDSGAGDWPSGLASHTGAERDGGFGAALQASGVDAPPSRVEWLDLQAHHEHPEQG